VEIGTSEWGTSEWGIRLVIHHVMRRIGMRTLFILWGNKKRVTWLGCGMLVDIYMIHLRMVVIECLNWQNCLFSWYMK